MGTDPLTVARDILAEMTDGRARSTDGIMATAQVGILAALIALCERLDTHLAQQGDANIALSFISGALDEQRTGQ